MSRSRSAEAGQRADPGWRARAGRRWGLRALALALVLLLGGHAIDLIPLAPLQRLDLALHDRMLAAFAPTTRDPRIAIVDIDEQALATHGRWPWRRERLAELIERIARDQGARLVALDMVLAEADPGPDARALARLLDGPLRDQPAAAAALRAVQPGLDDDARLAAVLQHWPVTLGLMLGTGAGPSQGPLPPTWLAAAQLGPRATELPAWGRHSANLPALQSAAQATGHLNGEFDVDGVVRRMPLLAMRDGRVVATLSLVMARQWLASPLGAGALAGESGATATVQPAGRAPAWEPLSALQLAGPGGAIQIPVDRHGTALVPYRRDGGFLRVSAADVLSGRLPAHALQGRVVLVGLGAAGLVDQRLTPLAGSVPGTDVHASLLAGLLDGQVRAVPAWSGALQALALVPAAWLMVTVLRRRGLWAGSLATAGLMLVALAASALAWTRLHAWVAPTVLVLLPALLLAAHLALSYGAVSRARRRLTELFGQYVPPELVAQMSRNPERYSLSSRSAELTVMFADVRDFTRIAQQLPPEQLSASMNLLMSHLTDIVREHRGTLDKYIGDAVMAFWGAPLDDADHARHAVDAGLAMLARLPTLRAELAPLGWPDVDLSIGINTGTMVVGDMGSRHRRAYTVMGDAVNVAARLQARCAGEGLQLVIGDATRRALGDRPCRSLGAWQVRGRDGTEPVWTPLPAPDARQAPPPKAQARG